MFSIKVYAIVEIVPADEFITKSGFDIQLLALIYKLFAKPEANAPTG